MRSENGSLLYGEALSIAALVAVRLGVIEFRDIMQLPEIVLPITDPETEWVRGRPRVKVSPAFRHGRVQLFFGTALHAWARHRGVVATEWRFRIQPPGEARRPLVPDVAFVDRALLHGRSMDELDAPAFAPTVAVEILSPGDARLDVADKIDVYLRGGTRLVIVADPNDRTMRVHDSNGARLLSGDDVLEHDALPEFSLQLDTFYASALDIVLP